MNRPKLWSDKKTSDKVRVDVVCPDCGVDFIRWCAIGSDNIRIKSVRCPKCSKINQRGIRGRNGEDIDRMRDLPPVKIFTRKEIAAIADTITIPKKRAPRVSYTPLG